MKRQIGQIGTVAQDKYARDLAQAAGYPSITAALLGYLTKKHRWNSKEAASFIQHLQHKTGLLKNTYSKPSKPYGLSVDTGNLPRHSFV